MKPSKIFEGEGSSLKRTFDEAVGKKLPEKLNKDNLWFDSNLEVVIDKFNELIDFLTEKEEYGTAGSKIYNRNTGEEIKPPESDWEKEFSKTFYTKEEQTLRCRKHNAHVTEEEIKSFISKNFISKAVLVERVEKLKPVGEWSELENYPRTTGFKVAIDEVLSIITNL